MPAKLPGWRIEPPVSVPVAPRAQRAATSEAAPPEVLGRSVIAGGGRRAHGELVHVGLAEHDGASLPQLGGDRRFIGRNEAVEDVRAGGGQHALGAEEVLYAERQPFEEPRLAAREARIGRLCL